MDNPLAITLDQFKIISRDFFLAASQVNTFDELDSIFKCVSLAYLNITPMPEPGSREEVAAVAIMRLAAKKFMVREEELERTEHFG